eukprot:TRINITY_DN10783_c0_g1_i1.p1 TRINITY_DN10783_c0_g1~~TRINITY_DN10783_c0_g1_i1.p1  ORF type:complete len:128 (+),score=12.17 TRINITY_DN10783_c0_g1_i1:154-537(+)
MCIRDSGQCGDERQILVHVSSRRPSRVSSVDSRSLRSPSISPFIFPTISFSISSIASSVSSRLFFSCPIFAWRAPHVPVSYTHLRAHETSLHLVCRLLLEKKKNKQTHPPINDHHKKVSIQIMTECL